MNNTTTTESSCDFPIFYRVAIVTLLGLATILAPVLNFLVVLAVWTSKKLQTPANVFIVSLSIGDVLISITLPPIEIVYVSLHPKWPLKAIGTHILNWIFLFSLVSPFVTVMVITIDRYKAVSSLIRYRESVTKAMVLRVIVFVWLYSIGSTSFMAYFFTPASDEYYEWNILPVYYYPFLGLHIVVPLLVICILYLMIFYSVRATSRKATDQSMQASSKRELRLAKTVGIVVGLLFFVWLPVLALEYFYAIGTTSCWVQMAGVTSVWLTSVNGIINPIVYSYRNPDFRKAMKNLMACFCKKRLADPQSEIHGTKMTSNASGSTLTGFSSIAETSEHIGGSRDVSSKDTKL